MFRRTLAIGCGLAAALACGAQTPQADTSVRHFRITFAIGNAGSSQPSQSFSIEVPVASDRPGVATIDLGSGLTGDALPETLAVHFSDIHESPDGLGLKISMTSDSESHVAGISEPVHHHGVFERQVDVVLNTPTVVTETLHSVPLGNGNPPQPHVVPPAPLQITVTATRI